MARQMALHISPVIPSQPGDFGDLSLTILSSISQHSREGISSNKAQTMPCQHRITFAYPADPSFTMLIDDAYRLLLSTASMSLSWSTFTQGWTPRHPLESFLQAADFSSLTVDSICPPRDMFRSPPFALPQHAIIHGTHPVIEQLNFFIRGNWSANSNIRACHKLSWI